MAKIPANTLGDDNASPKHHLIWVYLHSWNGLDGETNEHWFIDNNEI